ncbi:MAG: hypothetical protein H9W83_00730 [Leuconostoc sp.]|uniref:hypothetical protein n=1 Tax=Leuconostoc mesenteroides TaxID=1245 RepID=UPI000B8D9064|nr:hypothetical protein [Leuconostoc mesenteroides]ASR69260.1 hypothetical protein CBW60_07780 [Leuconostoc mesenteroides]MBC9701105.1 hypothetical protein [Leuconostoc sp.]TDV90389.1 hypothetical protein C7818_11076 [Leuconostoc mesenteroides]
MSKKMFLFLIILGMLIFVGGPLFVQYKHWPRGSNGNGDWLGFWGSYLGMVPSGLIAYFVAKSQIDAERNNERSKRNEDLYLQDLREIHKSLNEMRIIIGMMSQVFKYLELGERDAKYFADMYIHISAGNKHQLKYNEYFNDAVKALPSGASEELINNIKDMTDPLESLEVNVEFYISEIRDDTRNDSFDIEYKNKFLNDFRMMKIKYEAVLVLITKEIAKYYSID